MNCGASSVIPEKFSINDRAVVNCAGCGATLGVLVRYGLAPLFSSGDFIELNRIEQEVEGIETDLEQLSRELVEKGSQKELRLLYLLLCHLCRAKIYEALELTDNSKYDKTGKWERKSLYYSIQLSELFKFGTQERDRGFQGGDRYPYPYVFKPPEPPDDIGVSTNVQLNRSRKEEMPEVELFCRYCGSKLGMDESFCSICGKKV